MDITRTKPSSVNVEMWYKYSNKFYTGFRLLRSTPMQNKKLFIPLDPFHTLQTTYNNDR